MKRFIHVLVNVAAANVATFFLWTAFSFWVYLETQSVLILSILGGTYMLLVTFSGMIFGTLVDKHKKMQVITGAAVATMILLILSAIVLFLFNRSQIADLSSPAFWFFSIPLLLSALTGNLRSIALSATVAVLVPKGNYAKANGLVGMVQGIGMIANTVFSGLVIGRLGLDWAMYITLAVSLTAFIHLFFISIPEDHLTHDPEILNKQVDFKGALKAIHFVPGLMALIFFTTFNNFIGGVFMVLLDPYGLTLFPVEIWGIVLGITATGFIFGGIAINKKGLGKNPLRTLLYGYILVSVICIFFTLREWVWLFTGGIFLYMCLAPFLEAAEQTIIQTVVPRTKQGRVFGFAQTVESAATPISSFIIGPLAQFYIIPYMNGDAGKHVFGWLLGEGSARGIALTFVIAGVCMLILSFLAFRSKAYHTLTKVFREA